MMSKFDSVIVTGICNDFRFFYVLFQIAGNKTVAGAEYDINALGFQLFDNGVGRFRLEFAESPRNHSHVIFQVVKSSFAFHQVGDIGFGKQLRIADQHILFLIIAHINGF